MCLPTVPSEIPKVLDECQNLSFTTSVLIHILDCAEREDSRGRRLLIEATFSMVCKRLTLGGYDDDMEKICAQIVFSYFESVAASNQNRYIQVALACLLTLLRRKSGNILLGVFIGLGITKFAKSSPDSFRSVLATLSEDDKLFLQNAMRNAVLMQSSISMQESANSTANIRIDMNKYKKENSK